MNKAERELFLKNLGLSIKLERVRRGLSQEELAERAGLHRTYIGMVERAERNITVVNLALIAKALGVSIGSLLGED
ncbi:helix-turn-helix domain-containing protein [Actinobacillus minor]|uniref:XRE family transcriptional regulator n=1 Tax=Actinobacillus minor NM305 TaxID=637911 RepID=C5RZI4_9PAST|nr:helix-turn-helix transcriptional regulator [Actinobacillus minor]EER47839.1 XRE family transcriptional regulator [Actinobacillus minor NM305]MDD6910674.1 helix-turn-helix transcriptional regulator [Actinobacillus minor]MDY4714229.1 helix-turn-helix transcriptional regulator [Actinobacillus minor]MDY5106404.1 helix-turn-helix transcriptional regulator [Actinobacillus minor]